MSHHLLAGEAESATPATPGATFTAEHLRRLHLVRFAFAVAWAVAFALSASTLGAVSVALLVLYPAVDAAAAVWDHRASGATGVRGTLVLNAALSLLAAVGLALAAAAGEASVLRVWGAWAVTAGLVQLLVAVGRRRLGGQWPLVLSGGISTLAGTGFVLAANGTDPSLTGLAGYAALGGVFFLVSAFRLGRTARSAGPVR